MPQTLERRRAYDHERAMNPGRRKNRHSKGYERARSLGILVKPNPDCPLMKGLSVETDWHGAPQPFGEETLAALGELGCVCEDLSLIQLETESPIDFHSEPEDERKGTAGFAARTNAFAFVDLEGFTYHRDGCDGDPDRCRCPQSILLASVYGGPVDKERVFRLEGRDRVEPLEPRAVWNFLLDVSEKIGPVVFVGYGFGYDSEMLLPPRGPPRPTGRKLKNGKPERWDRLDRLDHMGVVRYGPYQFVLWERKRFSISLLSDLTDKDRTSWFARRKRALLRQVHKSKTMDEQVRKRTLADLESLRLEDVDPPKCKTTARIRVDDLLSSFGGKKFETVVDKMLPIDFFTPKERALLAKGKARRDIWTLDDYRSGFVRKYNLLEGRAGVAMVRMLNKARRQADCNASDFYSPTVIAKSWFKLYGVKAALKKPLPEDTGGGAYTSVREAAYKSMFGGRIEAAAYGTYMAPVSEDDKNSAYPDMMRRLPNLGRGRWVHDNERIDGQVVFREGSDRSLYKVLIDFPDDAVPRFLPLAWRDQNGAVFFPNHEITWSWSSSVRWCVENCPAYVTLLEAIHFEEDDPSDRPFAWIDDKYAARMKCEAEAFARGRDPKADPIANSLKLGLNSAFGATAQRVSARKTGEPPTYHNIAVAGLITDFTRASVLRAAFEAWDSKRNAPATIAIATDAIIRTGDAPPPPSIEIGTALGEWKTERYAGYEGLGNGLYRLFPVDTNGKPVERARGVRQRAIPWDEAHKARAEGKTELTFRVTQFVGHKNRDKKRTWRAWIRVPRTIQLANAGAKRDPDLDEMDKDPSKELVWTMPKTLPMINEETAPNLPDFSSVVDPRTPPSDDDTCEATEEIGE